jgi:hypothetical protein
MLHSLKMSEHNNLINDLLSNKAKLDLGARKKRQKDEEQRYEIDKLWKEAEMEKAEDERDLQKMKLRLVRKLAKKTEEKALQATLDYNDAREMPLEVPKHMLKKQKPLKSDEEREKTRAAGAPPPVGTWSESIVTFGASIGLTGISPWFGAGAPGS